MRDIALRLERKISEGGAVDFDEAYILGRLSKPDELEKLYHAANRIRERYKGNKVDLCSIMNAKSGRCSEDCKYCAQSAHYHTEVEEYGLVCKDKALAIALENESCGVGRFSLVTSGRDLAGEDFKETLNIYGYIKEHVKISLCASHGILTHEQLLLLKRAGVETYHHNLETSREYYSRICTTHSYDERIETIRNAQNAGLKVCSGGIIGMGERLEDRIKLAFELKALGIDSIPINVLSPIKGTPLESSERLSQDEILKTIAIYRFINPKACIRLAGGRNLIADYGKHCFKAGANATITGNYLTTSGNKIADDIKMIKDSGLKVGL